MGWFQLDPESIAARAKSAGTSMHVPSLPAAVWRGVIGFTLVSIAGFAPWALFGRWFYRTIGEAGLYAVCALVFIGLSAPLMHKLIIGHGSLSRFYKLFTGSFSAYSIAWIAGWMLLRGHPGSLVGLLAGTAAMGWMLAHAFDAERATFRVITALFVLNALGYFLGGWVEGSLAGARGFSLLGWTPTRSSRITIAKLLWGVFYGMGLGAGLGLAFYFCQARARDLLLSNRENAA